MRKSFRVLLAAIYIAVTFAVLVTQTQTAGAVLGAAKSTTASRLKPLGDFRWATDPHFSHAKKTGSDIDFSPIPSLLFSVTSAGTLQPAFHSNYQAFLNPVPARAPP